MISRLKLESGEFDSKIKRAAQGIRQMADECHKAGGELNVLEDENREYIKSIGQMETVNKTARGSVAELTAAFLDMKKVYNELSEEEKNGEVGRELNKQLGILKQRIDSGNEELKSMQKELGGNGLSGALDQVAGKFGLNIKQLTGWGAALGAGKMALDVAKDAFFASEATVDEWGRTMDASKSLYEGFLTAINTGDISGYLNRIDDIVKAARTAYDELDRLGTMQRIQSPQKSAQQTENERMRMMIQTGRYIAPVDGRSNAVFNGRVMQNGDKLTAGQIRAIERQLQGGLQKTTQLIENEVKQTTRAISALYDRQSKELGLSKKEFMAGTSSMAEFDKRIAGYQQYQQWRSQHTTIDQQSGREIVARGNPYQEYAKWGNFRVDGDRYNQLVQLVLQREQQMQQAYSMQGQTYRTINRAEGFNVRQLLGGGGGTGGSGGGKVVVATDPYAGMFQGGPALTSGLSVGMISGNPRESMRMGWGLDYWTRQRYNQANKKAEEKQAKDGEGKQIDLMTQTNQVLSNVSSSVNNVFTGIERLGIEIPQGLRDVIGVLDVIAGICSAIQGMQTVGSILGLFSRGGVVHAAGGYSVPGNYMSGDQVPAMLNSGELVLSQFQQQVLAANLQAGGMQNLHLSASVHGEQIVLAVNNTMKRKNKGELATFR